MIGNRFLTALSLTCLALPGATAQSNPHIEPIPMDVLESLIDPVEIELAEGDAFEVQPISDDQLDDLMATYLADAELQTERPEVEPEPIEYRPAKRPNWFARFLASIFNLIGEIIGYVLLAVIAGALLYCLYLMFGESLTLRGRDKAKKTEPDISIMPNLRPEKAVATALLEDADKLAAEGRFAEAVHLLLFRSISDIQEKKQGSVPKSLTSREIGRLESLPAKVRSALSPIISIVEGSFFGDRDVDQNGWQQARASYQNFAFGEAWA